MMGLPIPKSIPPMSYNGISRTNPNFNPIPSTMPWVEWFAWYPVKIHGERVWFKTVYRRLVNTYSDYDDWERYEYGNIFDVLKHNYD